MSAVHSPPRELHLEANGNDGHALSKLWNFGRRLNWDSSARISYQLHDMPFFASDSSNGKRHTSYRWHQGISRQLLRFDWSTIESLGLEAEGGSVPYANGFLGDLQTAVTENEVSVFLVLSLHES